MAFSYFEKCSVEVNRVHTEWFLSFFPLQLHLDKPHAGHCHTVSARMTVKPNDLQSLQLEEFALPAVWRPIFKVKTSSAGTQWVTMHAGLAVSQALVISDKNVKYIPYSLGARDLDDSSGSSRKK